MKWTITSEQAGMNIRDFLKGVAGFSRRILTATKSEQGGILVNGKEETVRKVLTKGDILEVTLPPKPVSKWLYPEEMDLAIVYEDASVLILNKEPGIPTLPSPKHPSHTIANGVLFHYKKEGNPNTIHVVTRLDKDTSGLLLIAKDRLSHSFLSRSQKRFEIQRKYLAIVEGEIEQDEGKIDAPIGRKADSIIERQVTSDGKSAISYFRVVERMKGYTLVEVELETGRTHQIRVHLAYIGHPLVGDDLYGGSRVKMNRQALHCHKLSFVHPFTNEIHTMEAPVSNDMKELIDQLNIT